jgi:uncharacterized protein YecT (DUF1311 family)
MIKRIFIMFAIFVFSSIAAASTLCNSKITRELEACARNNFELSDKQLNGAYRTLASKLQREDAQMLLTAQRAWVAYKEKTCQGAYDATSPGEEAGIDKWTCLDEITKTRLRELQYLESGAGLAVFFMPLMWFPNTMKMEAEIDSLPSWQIRRCSKMIRIGICTWQKTAN